MTEEEYRQEWLKGLHNTDYNNCRFAEDKTQYAIEWTKKNVPSVNLENPQKKTSKSIKTKKALPEMKRTSKQGKAFSIFSLFRFLNLYSSISSASFSAVNPKSSAIFFAGPDSPNLLIVNKSFLLET